MFLELNVMMRIDTEFSEVFICRIFREAIWKNLITPHHMVAKGMMHVKDFDMDGGLEILYEAPKYFVTVKPHYGGAVVESSSRTRFYNYVDVIARRYEHYHEAVEAAVLPRRGWWCRKASTNSRRKYLQK